MRAQKNSEDDESGLEAVKKLACFGNECVSKSGGITRRQMIRNADASC